jgi:hypothetical protein
MNADVPTDFPCEFLGAVHGAHPKLLVRKNERGEYVTESESHRAQRWAICADLCEQLVDYVNKQWAGEGPRQAFVEKVVRALDARKSRWGISRAESDWITARLRADMSPGCRQS